LLRQLGEELRERLELLHRVRLATELQERLGPRVVGEEDLAGTRAARVVPDEVIEGLLRLLPVLRLLVDEGDVEGESGARNRVLHGRVLLDVLAIEGDGLVVAAQALGPESGVVESVGGLERTARIGADRIRRVLEARPTAARRRRIGRQADAGLDLPLLRELLV